MLWCIAQSRGALNCVLNGVALCVELRCFLCCLLLWILQRTLNADSGRFHREPVSSPHTELHPHRLRGKRQKRSSCLRSLKLSFLLSFSWMTAWGELAGRGWKAGVWGVSCYHQRCFNGVVIEGCTVRETEKEKEIERSAYAKNN